MKLAYMTGSSDMHFNFVNVSIQRLGLSSSLLLPVMGCQKAGWIQSGGGRSSHPSRLQSQSSSAVQAHGYASAVQMTAVSLSNIRVRWELTEVVTFINGQHQVKVGTATWMFPPWSRAEFVHVSVKFKLQITQALKKAMQLSTHHNVSFP